jgi:hypothetical protein
MLTVEVLNRISQLSEIDIINTYLEELVELKEIDYNELFDDKLEQDFISEVLGVEEYIETILPILRKVSHHYDNKIVDMVHLIELSSITHISQLTKLAITQRKISKDRRLVKDAINYYNKLLTRLKFFKQNANKMRINNLSKRRVYTLRTDFSNDESVNHLYEFILNDNDTFVNIELKTLSKEQKDLDDTELISSMDNV